MTLGFLSGSRNFRKLLWVSCEVFVLHGYDWIHWVAKSFTTTAYRWLFRDSQFPLRTLWSAVIKSPKNFSTRYDSAIASSARGPCNFSPLTDLAISVFREVSIHTAFTQIRTELLRQCGDCDVPTRGLTHRAARRAGRAGVEGAVLAGCGKARVRKAQRSRSGSWPNQRTPRAPSRRRDLGSRRLTHVDDRPQRLQVLSRATTPQEPSCSCINKTHECTLVSTQVVMILDLRALLGQGVLVVPISVIRGDAASVPIFPHPRSSNFRYVAPQYIQWRVCCSGNDDFIGIRNHSSFRKYSLTLGTTWWRQMNFPVIVQKSLFASSSRVDSSWSRVGERNSHDFPWRIAFSSPRSGHSRFQVDVLRRCSPPKILTVPSLGKWVEFWCVHLLQFFNVCDHNAPFPAPFRRQHTLKEFTWQNFCSKLMQSWLVFRRITVTFDHCSRRYSWPVKTHSERPFIFCFPTSWEILNVGQKAITFHKIRTIRHSDWTAIAQQMCPLFHSAHCSFSNPISLRSVWYRLAMIPRKIFTNFAKFQRIVSVNDFRLLIRLQKLLQAPFSFLRSFWFAQVRLDSLGGQVLHHNSVSMIVSRFTTFTENFVICCDQTKIFRSLGKWV